jgi:hypothetical protein
MTCKSTCDENERGSPAEVAETPETQELFSPTPKHVNLTTEQICTQYDLILDFQKFMSSPEKPTPPFDPTQSDDTPSSSKSPNPKDSLF